MVSTKVFFFLIVHISTNFVLDGPKLWMDVPNIHVEGSVSQIFVLGLTFHFMSKNGNFMIIYLIFFLSFIKKRTRTYTKNLKHSSLHSNVFNTFVKFQV